MLLLVGLGDPEPSAFPPDWSALVCRGRMDPPDPETKNENLLGFGARRRIDRSTAEEGLLFGFSRLCVE
jgi:hypothetical protein